LTPDARQYVKMLAPTLKRMNMEMTFEGHTDARQFPAGHMDNFTLSGARADSLKNALKDDGIPMKQIVGEMGYGDQELAYPNDPLNPRNRRVTIWVHTAKAADLKKLLDPDIKSQLKEDIKPDRPDISPKAPDVEGKGESPKA
jgi:chemotaxis protein MotB